MVFLKFLLEMSANCSKSFDSSILRKDHENCYWVIGVYRCLISQDFYP